MLFCYNQGGKLHKIKLKMVTSDHNETRKKEKNAKLFLTQSCRICPFLSSLSLSTKATS